VLALAIPRVDGVYLATLALATVAAYEAILPLGQAAAYISATFEAAKRVFEFSAVSPAVTDPALPKQPPQRFDLHVENITFGYKPDEPPVLRNASLAIPQGQRVAILGQSGAGKSTLAHLLVRFWDYESGSIRVGDAELRDLTQHDTRRIFGLMAQRTHLFNTTVRENIRIARPDAGDAEVEAAAEAAQIHDFIMSLPDGYETQLDEDGTNLSGGERQRIALARVLLKDAPILILDEATANLDTVTEREVMETIAAASEGRTLIVFTHHLHLLRYVDAVYELSAGELHPVRADAPELRSSVPLTG
jgi:ATP-binding cassette subfamily C protein CydC